MAAYNASKAAVLAITETLHTELEAYQINVSCLMPLYVRTSLHQTLIGTDEAVTIARKLITGAQYAADDVARYALEKAGKGDLYIFFPNEARRLWWFKRLSTRLYFRYMLRSMQRHQ